MSAKSLPKRPLGSTGLQVPVLSFGASPLGGIYNKTSTDEVGIKAVHKAFELGINYFDTAPHYGDGKSEEVLGRALSTLPRNEIIVASKTGQYAEHGFDFSAQKTYDSVKLSIERLQVPYLDLLQCHDVEYVDIDQVINEALPVLQKLKKDGLIRHIGFSCYPLACFHKMLDRVEPGTFDTVLAYCHNSLNNTLLTKHVPYFQSKGLGIISASPLSMGLLAPQGPPEWHPAPQDLKDTCHKAVKAAEKKGASLPDLAIRYSVQNTDIATTLVGMHTPEEVEHNFQTALSAFQEPSQTDKDALEEVHAILAPVKDRPWSTGKPENN